MAIKNRYYLIACGTSDCKNYEELDNLDHIDKDIERITKVFTEKFGYQRVLLSLDINPRRSDFIGNKTNSFADWLEDDERQETDIIVFYYSGHGLKDDRHYLVLKDTERGKEWQTAIATEDLVRPLTNKKVKISQILFIIDTCYSQKGASDLVKLAQNILGNSEKVEGKNIDVHVIAACRTKQKATDGEFSKAFVQALGELSADSQKCFIEHSKIVDKVNYLLENDEQNAKFNAAFCEQKVNFFPCVPTTIQNWEQERKNCVKELVCILNKDAKSSLNAINYFIISCDLTIDLILQERDIEEKLSELSQKKVDDGVCPLIACSEWCRKKLENSYQNLAIELRSWQQNTMKFREDASVDKISDYVRDSFTKFEQIVKTKKWRILVEIEPQLDPNGTGLSTGKYYFNLQLWVAIKNYPPGRFAEKVLLVLKAEDDHNLQNLLIDAFAKQELLVELIAKAEKSLSFPLKLDIEFLIPLELYSLPVDQLTFKYARRRKYIGVEYPLFINSYERYYHPDFWKVKNNLCQQKEEFWNEAKEFSEDDKFYFSGSQVPSEDDLLDIEENYSIAVWTRNKDHPIELGKDLKKSEWREWPQKIQKLRKDKKDLEITLFWDDMFPKPRPKKLLNTNLVE